VFALLGYAAVIAVFLVCFFALLDVAEGRKLKDTGMDVPVRALLAPFRAAWASIPYLMLGIAGVGAYWLVTYQIAADARQGWWVTVAVLACGGAWWLCRRHGAAIVRGVRSFGAAIIEDMVGLYRNYWWRF